MIPVVLRIWALDSSRPHLLKVSSATDITFDDKVYSFAAIHDEPSKDWHKELTAKGALILIGPTGSGKTTTLKGLMEEFVQEPNATVSAFEVSRNSCFVDLLDNKAQKKYMSSIPVEAQIKRVKLSPNVMGTLFSLRLTAPTKANAQSSRSCMLVSLKSATRNLTIVDMMGSEKYDLAGSSNTFANLNVSAITLMLINRTSTKRSSNLVTNLIFNGILLTKNIKFVLHLDKTGDSSLIKSALNNIADVIRGFKFSRPTNNGVKPPTRPDTNSVPLYARPTASSASPRKKLMKRPFPGSTTTLPTKQPKITSKALPSQRHAHSKTNLTDRLRRTFTSESNALAKPLAELKVELEGANASNLQLKERNDELEATINELKETNIRHASEKQKYEVQLEEKEAQVKKLQSLVAEAQEKESEHKDEFSRLQQEVKESSDENEELQNRLQEQLSILSEKGEELVQQLNDKAKQINCLSSQLEVTRKEVAAKDKIIENLEEEVGALVGSLQEIRRELDSRLANLEEERDELSKKLETQSNLHNLYTRETEETIRKLYSEILNLNSDVGSTEKELVETKKVNAKCMEQLNLATSKANTLTQQIKKQEESNASTQNFLQVKIKNAAEENERLQADLDKAKIQEMELKKRNEVLAEEKNVVENSEAGQRAKVAELEDLVEELQKYKSKCEYLDGTLADLRTQSQSEELKLRKQVAEFKEHIKKLTGEHSIPKISPPSFEIHEDTNYKAFLKQMKKANRRADEPQSSPLKERNNVDRKQKKRHSLQIPVKVLT